MREDRIGTAKLVEERCDVGSLSLHGARILRRAPEEEHLGSIVVLEQIEDLNRAAKSAFDGQSEIVAKFNQ